MKKRNIIFVVMVIFGVSLVMGSVSAVENNGDKTICKNNSSHNATVSIVKTHTKQLDDVKKNGSYYKVYATYGYRSVNCEYNNNYIRQTKPSLYCKYHESNSFTEYEYVKYKSTDIVKKSVKNYNTKLTQKNGKVYKSYTAKTTIIYGNTKTKTKTNKIKEIYGYYKKIKMPSLKVNRVKLTKFKGTNIIYGRWGYEWGISSPYGNIYKIKATGTKVKYADYKYWKFSKKPSSFTVYIKA